VWLRYAEGLSMKEIAAVLGKTLVGVRVSLFRAREALAARPDLAREAGRPVEVRSARGRPVAGGVR
jgi:DNA-directed RNA polymerase specialized sigma24 family protein